MQHATNNAANKSDTAPSVLVALREEVAQLKHELQWFRKQLFGSKSEKRLEPRPDQLSLLSKQQAPDPEEPEKEKITDTRGKGKKRRNDDSVSE